MPRARPRSGREGLVAVVNLFLVIPGLPFMIVIAAYLQNGGITVIIAVIVITGWAWGARVLRSQTQSLRSRDFVEAARFSGDSAPRIVFREILPNMTSLIVGSFFGAATAAILAEATLAYIGIGVQPPRASWGSLVSEGQKYIRSDPHLVFFPAICIAIALISFTFLGDGLRDALDPKLKGKQ